MQYLLKVMLYVALAGSPVWIASTARAELLCDCTQVVDSCDASVSMSGTRVNIESSNSSCSRVDYLIEGQPYTALIVGGSGELAGPSLPMRNARVVVENCRVCAESGVTGKAAMADVAKKSEEDTGAPRSIIKVMPEYPRGAWMNKLEGDVTLEFTVNAEGTVENIKVINSSNPLFDLAAIDAVSRFKFAPAHADNKAAATTGVRERFQFRLLNDGTQTSVTSSSSSASSGSASSGSASSG